MIKPPLRVNQQFYNLVTQANVPAELISSDTIESMSKDWEAESKAWQFA